MQRIIPHRTDDSRGAFPRPRVRNSALPPGIGPRRSAAIVVEFLLSFPIFLVFLATVIEFALIIDASQQVAQAARLGAKIAAETAHLGDIVFDPPLTATTAASIRSAVDRELENAGFGASASQGVTLRHTVGTTAVATDGYAPDPTLPAMPTDAVRVSVSVPLGKVTPNLLQSFGFNTDQRTIDISATYPYEQ